ncbi:radical SAM/SPASM domain-containing protein [Peptostreptococcus porci]|uniref:radical SAM/SPASM domain-containing protein n=1 Tax=Peptostreptococcus porci TaxID=2652282 RepID=UPI002A80C9CD|nr:radical SAM protein [Peptostreptococcus porci]MDY4128744.1 radical SAM protein [Peptostreptococcus porci]
MYQSKYNIIQNSKNKVIVYNTFSGGIISLNQEEFSVLNGIEKDAYDSNNKHALLYDELLRGNFIETEYGEQLNKLKFESYYSRYSKNEISLTIAPTTNCNFRCPYCYEKGIKYEDMSDEVVKNVIDFINSQNTDVINICWYGGEPLLEIDTIEKIIKGIRKDGLTINNSIVTNGYLLDGCVRDKLKELNILNIQITIDGPEFIHDKRRFRFDGGKTFRAIIENITHLCKDAHISLRVNVDKTNIGYIDNLMEYLEKEGILDNVHIYLAPVDDINMSLPNSDDLYINYDENDFTLKQKDFLKRMLLKNGDYIFEERNPYLCGAVSPHSLLIDPLGDLYKCWNDIGRKEYKIGNIKDGVVESDKLYKWLSYDPFRDEECINCSVFPICLNGCPYSVIRKNKKICDSNKNNYKELLTTFL